MQDLIAELVAKGYRIVYTDGSSKRLSHKDMRRAGGFGMFAAEDEQGPEVRFCGYVPTHHRPVSVASWPTKKHLAFPSAPPPAPPGPEIIVVKGVRYRPSHSSSPWSQPRLSNDLSRLWASTNTAQILGAVGGGWWGQAAVG